MDIYQHLLSVARDDPIRKIQAKKSLKDNKFYIPLDQRDIDRQKAYKAKRNKNQREIVAFERSHLIFQCPWDKLNKAQKMNRLIMFAKQNNEDKHQLITALEKRRLKEVKYDEKNGHIISIELKK